MVSGVPNSTAAGVQINRLLVIVHITSSARACPLWLSEEKGQILSREQSRCVCLQLAKVSRVLLCVPFVSVESCTRTISYVESKTKYIMNHDKIGQSWPVESLTAASLSDPAFYFPHPGRLIFGSEQDKLVIEASASLREGKAFQASCGLLLSHLFSIPSPHFFIFTLSLCVFLSNLQSSLLLSRISLLSLSTVLICQEAWCVSNWNFWDAAYQTWRVYIRRSLAQRCAYRFLWDRVFDDCTAGIFP